MNKGKTELVSVRVVPITSGGPAGKLADAELTFEADAGPLSGLKLIGFSIWERRSGGRNVTFPARAYSVNGEHRSFALLRPANGDASAQEAMRDYILDAYILHNRVAVAILLRERDQDVEHGLRQRQLCLRILAATLFHHRPNI